MSRAPPDRAWQAAFARWLRPFLAALRREAQRRWAPVYLEGLLGPGERKSVAPMAARVAPDDVQQLHHFVATSPWATAPLEHVLAEDLAFAKGMSAKQSLVSPLSPNQHPALRF